MFGASYGWRARIGFIGPSGASENNPYEFYLMAPEGVTIVLTRLGVNFNGHADPEIALAGLEAAALELHQRGVDSIVQVGVPYLVAGGPGFERQVLDRIARITAIPATCDIVTCVDALHALEVSKVALVTPFPDGTNQDVVHYLQAYDITVTATQSVVPTPGQDLSVKPLNEIYHAAKRAFGCSGRADAVLINGARMPTVAIIDALEEDLGVPVVTSMQAMTWAGLRLAGVNPDVSGYGRLMQLAPEMRRATFTSPL